MELLICMHMIPLEVTFVKPKSEFNLCELRLLLHRVLLEIE
jgi:hypothetical protein